MRLAAIRRSKNPSVREDENLVRVGPINHAISAVPVLNVKPGGSIFEGGSVILQTAEDDARVGRMLRDEVAAQAGKPDVLRRKRAGAARVAVEKHAAVAAAPQFV